MRHAGAAAIHRLGPLLAELRRLDGLTERRPGIFYRRSKAFLHFHEDPKGLFADVRLGDDFARFPVNTARQGQLLLRRIERRLRRP